MKNHFFCFELNQDSPDPILYLHGGGLSYWSWQETAELLPEYHGFIPDLRGHGNNVDLKPFTMELAASDLIALIEDRIKTPVTLVGLSLGSQVALQLASMRPDLVKRMILSGTLVRPQPGSSLIKWFTAPYMPMRNMPFLIKANMKSENLDPRFYPLFARDTRLLDLDNFSQYMAANLRFKLPESLPKITTPCLVIAGQKELPVILASARDLCSILSNSVGFVVRGQKHGWCINQPGLAAETICAFIENKALPGSLIPLNC